MVCIPDLFLRKHFSSLSPEGQSSLIRMLRKQGLAEICKAKCWNDCSSVYNSDAFTLSIVNRYPVQAAMVFKCKKNRLLNDIIRCPSSRSTRLSRDYAQRESGAYTRVAGFNLVVEPQMDGRLHLHMTVYGSAYTPGLLTRIAYFYT